MKKFALTVVMLCAASAVQAQEWSYWRMDAKSKFLWGVHYGLWYQKKYDCAVERSGNKKGYYNENNLPDNMEWARQSDITDYVHNHCIPNKKPTETAHFDPPKVAAEKPKALSAQASIPQKPTQASVFNLWPNPPQLPPTQVNEDSPFSDRWRLLN